MTSQENEKAQKPLRCPYCGGGLWINTETVGPAYLTYETPESIECAEVDCGAAWEPNGAARTAARWIEWPDLYSEPARSTSPESTREEDR